MNKIKIMKSLVLLSILLFMVSIVHAVRIPLASEKNWATSPIYGLEKWLLESHTANGTLKSDMNISANVFNITNNLIVFGNISGEIPTSFKNLNWSNLYVAEANTRYSLANFTSNYDARLDRFSNVNFTSRYDAITDRFSVVNYTALEDSAFRIENGTRLQFSNFQNANASGIINGYIPSFFNNGNFSTRLDLASTAFFSNGNFTTRYDLRADRYSKENFTAQIDSNGFFKLENYSSEYSSTGYKLINFTNNYDLRTDRFGIVNGTALSFSNFRIENISSSEQNPSNATIFLPSQEKIDGLKSTDSPKFSALNITNKITIGGTDGTSKLQIIGGGVATANATANNCNVGEIRANVTSATTGKICVCLNSLVVDEAVWKCSVLG